jgi:hypothetical protein
MKVQDDTVLITITSRMAKTGKSTVARIIMEALGKVGLTVGVEDTYVPQYTGITDSIVRHADAIGVLADRRQSILIKVTDGYIVP